MYGVQDSLTCCSASFTCLFYSIHDLLRGVENRQRLDINIRVERLVRFVRTGVFFKETNYKIPPTS